MGDLITYEIFGGEVQVIEKRLDVGTVPPKSSRMSSHHPGSGLYWFQGVSSVYYGTVLSMNKERLLFTTTLRDEDMSVLDNYNGYAMSDSVRVYCYNERVGIESGTKKDILTYNSSGADASVVALIASRGGIKYAYVIK